MCSSQSFLIKNFDKTAQEIWNSDTYGCKLVGKKENGLKCNLERGIKFAGMSTWVNCGKQEKDQVPRLAGEKRDVSIYHKLI